MERTLFISEWKGSPFCGWAHNFCHKNAWRVKNYVGDYEDCMAECALVYTQVRHRYGADIVSPQQFMSLFRVCVMSHFNTLANKDTQFRIGLENLEKPNLAIQQEGSVLVALREASTELQDVMQLLINAPQEIMDIVRIEAGNYSPKKFFQAALRQLNIKPSKGQKVMRELERILA